MTADPKTAPPAPRLPRPASPGTSRAQTRARNRIQVLQVPEQCGWNPYVAAAETALTAAGATVLRPGWCADDPGPAPAPEAPDPTRVRPDIVHVHWPEKLAAALGGPRPALKLLEDLADGGTVIVQTIHNVAPHEPTPELMAYRHAVDQLTGGIICFSPDHETLARAARPCLPRQVLHLPHPLYPSTSGAAAAAFPRPGGLRIGCLGRIRPYKRTAAFARAFSSQAPVTAMLLIAGACDDPAADRELRAIAGADPRVDYRPGFTTGRRYQQLLADVGWVALPYQDLYSSGALVAALQAGRRILSPAPAGGTALYLQHDKPDPGWITVSPWNDDEAVLAAAAASPLPARPRPLALPSWDEAAARLCAFYQQIISARLATRA